VLLATPLIRTLRRTWPAATIDALVFRSTAGVLSGNPDLGRIIEVPERSKWRQRLSELRGLWNDYDLSFSCVPSDRARIYGWAAARTHFGMIAEGEPEGKRRLMTDALRFDDLDTHTVAMVGRLAELAGAPCGSEVVLPTAGGALPAEAAGQFVVFHPFPKFAYKMWTHEGWVGLAAQLRKAGFQVLLTGSNDPDEVACCAAIAAAGNAVSLAGRLSLAQTADLLRQARLFVGTDTAVTHMAAAAGIRTVALFGPSNPVKWGPWPVGCTEKSSPWARVGSGRHGNVYLLQGVADCVPCRLEGCDRHTASLSRCLQEMPLARVLEAAQTMLGTRLDSDPA